jgi:chromosome segregation ATPase
LVAVSLLVPEIRHNADSLTPSASVQRRDAKRPNIDEQRLAALEDRLEELLDERARTQVQLDNAERDFARRVSELREQKRTALEAMETKLAEHRSEADRLQGELTQYVAEAGQLAEKALRGEELAKRLEELGEELDTVQEALSTMRSRAERGERLIALLQQRFAREYISASGGRSQGLAALQNAARRNKLLERLAPLRKATSDPKHRTILNEADALLSRLELVEVGRRDAVQAWRKAVRNSRIVGDLDSLMVALLAEDDGAELFGWVLEARAIFSEAGNVG